METKLDWSSFSELFGSWADRFQPFFQKGGFDEIYEKLKFDSARGKSIAPLSHNVFRCFKETPIDDVKVILCGMAPYHTFYNNIPVADGLCLSCGITRKLQPSLEKWYDELERINQAPVIREPDLSYLAHSGVLMLNASLTTERGKPGSHATLWEPFMEYLLDTVIGANGAPIVFLGREATKLKKYVFPFTWIFELQHPAAAAYSSGDWNSDGIFNKLNRILKDNSNTNIQWIKTD